MYPGVSIDGEHEEDIQYLPLSQPLALPGDFGEEDGDYHSCPLQRSASCTEHRSEIQNLNMEHVCFNSLKRKRKHSGHYCSGSSQSLNVNITTAPHSNVPIFVISDLSSSYSEGLSRFPSLFDEYYQGHRVDSENNLRKHSKDHTANDFPLNSSSLHEQHLTKSHSYTSYALLCSSDNDEIPRVSYHDNSPFSLPDMTLPPSHY